MWQCWHGDLHCFNTSAVQELGLDDQAMLELIAVVDLFSGFNKLMDGLRIEPDEKPWCG